MNKTSVCLTRLDKIKLGFYRMEKSNFIKDCCREKERQYSLEIKCADLNTIFIYN